MKAYRCLIVDDEPTARDILESYVEKLPQLQLAGSCGSAIEAFKVLHQEPLDLIFLDINMPEISGLSFARTIPKGIKVIFTTAYREYAVDGFDLHAVDYLLKPISLDRFILAVNKFLDIQTPHPVLEIQKIEDCNADFIFVRSERKMIKVDFSSIIYVESLSDYISIQSQTKKIVSRETISNIEAKLPRTGFLRIHRSYLVAIAAISSYTNEYVELNGKSLPISRSYRKTVLERLEMMS